MFPNAIYSVLYAKCPYHLVLYMRSGGEAGRAEAVVVLHVEAVVVVFVVAGVEVDAAAVHDGRGVGREALAEDDVVRAHLGGGGAGGTARSAQLSMLARCKAAIHRLRGIYQLNITCNTCNQSTYTSKDQLHAPR